MKRLIVISIFTFLIVFIATIEITHAGPTRVGNGDDGGDLESAMTVKSGILVETRDEAVQLLKKLNVNGVEGLGRLIPETEKSEILLVGRNVDLAKTDASPEERSDAMEEAKAIGAVNDKSQPVYARTFPEAHAATRFFPAALLLDRKQLVALHIHEALHRSLPENIRENEKAVSRITLALTSGDSSFDRVKETVGREIAAAAPKRNSRGGLAGSDGGQSSTRYDDPDPVVERPNVLEYGYRSFFLPDPEKSLSPVSSLHSLKSFMYPFGRSAALGVGIELTFVMLPERSYLGPVGLSGRLKLATWRKSDVDLIAALHLNTLSDGEIKNTPIGRDTGTIGIAVRRDEKFFRVENQIYVTTGSEAKQNLGGIEYTHKYGAIFGARVAGVGKVPLTATSSLEWGGRGEVLLANPHEVRGGAFEKSSSRLRVVSIGPEVGYVTGDLRFSLSGRFIVDSTEGVSLDQIGDLMGHGVGQGSFGGAVSWQF